MGLWHFTRELGTYCWKDAVQKDPPNQFIYKPGEEKNYFFSLFKIKIHVEL